MTYRELMTFDSGAPELPVEVAEQVEISVKYEGYIRRQEKQVEELRQLEKHRLPAGYGVQPHSGTAAGGTGEAGGGAASGSGAGQPHLRGVPGGHRRPDDLAAHPDGEGGRHMKMLDLTHCITPEMPVYPGTEPPRLTAACTMEKDGFRETLLQMYSHTGTHMDAPAHMLPNGRTLDDFPAETFAGRGFVVDCGERRRSRCPCCGGRRRPWGRRSSCCFAPVGPVLGPAPVL